MAHFVAKRKSVASSSQQGKKAKRAATDEFLESGSDEDSLPIESEGKDPYEGETPDERRLRLAQLYLRNVGNEFDQEPTEESATTIDRLNQRLQQDVLRSEGRLKKLIAHKLAVPFESSVSILGRMPLSVTCLSLTRDDSIVYAGCKDGTISCWDVQSGLKLHTFRSQPSSRKIRASFSPAQLPSLKSFILKHAEKATGHIGQVLAVAVSSDGCFLASGGTDRLVRLWDTQTRTQLRALSGHQDAISSLCFREGTHTLYSGSHDRTVKVWDIDQFAYVETLYGHQSEVLALDALQHDRALSSGGADHSLRLWKIAEESQLVYRGPPSHVDAAKFVNDQLYVSGAADGTVSLWLSSKKKSIAEEKAAHGGSPISSVGAVPYTDLLASGASDGYLRFWRAATSAAGSLPAESTPLPRLSGGSALQPIAAVPLIGHLNAISFARSGQFAIVGVGQEHRCGRWRRIAEARNGVHLVKLE